MEPIINPWIFYWADVADGMHFLLLLFMVLPIVMIALIGIAWGDIKEFYDEDSDEYKDKIKKIKKFFIISIICLISSVLLCVFIPSKQTIYQMTIASYITEDNLENAKDEVKEMIDYAAEKFNGGR